MEGDVSGCVGIFELTNFGINGIKLNLHIWARMIPLIKPRWLTHPATDFL